jgi:hypothetical protein
MVLALLVTNACTAPGSGELDENDAHVVSYFGAASWLAGLEAAEAEEQLWDWARLALASSLGMEQDRVVDALYDTPPLRDPVLNGLVEQPVGPGGSLFDGRTLHILVPEQDPHPSHTLGRLLDQYRVDSGADPAEVQVHRYRMRPENQEDRAVRAAEGREPGFPRSQRLPRGSGGRAR